MPEDVSLTERQRQIMLAVLREFMRSSESVGSSVIVRRYHVDASPATIRSEMVKLGDMGLLKKVHHSAGRTPTEVAINMFLDKLVDLNSLSPSKLEPIRQELFRTRFEKDKLLYRAVDKLSELTKKTSIAMYQGVLYIRGLGNVCQSTKSKKKLSNVLDFLEDRSKVSALFSRFSERALPEYNVAVVMGKDSGLGELEDYSLVFTQFRLFGGNVGSIGCLGKKSMNYTRVVPVVHKVGDILGNLVKGW